MHYVYVDPIDTARQYAKVIAEHRENEAEFKILSAHNTVAIDEQAESVFCPDPEKVKAWADAGVTIIGFENDSGVSDDAKPVADGGGESESAKPAA